MDYSVKKFKEYGRGIVADRSFEEGEVIMTCPIIRLSRGDWHFVQNTTLASYVFSSENEFSGDCFLALGYGSLLNHDDDPNVDYDTDENKLIITLKALRDIKKNEQLFINYNWEEDDVW